MVDTTHIDLLQTCHNDTVMKKVTSSNGGEYAGPCPFCGGKDRFHVWPNKAGGGRWWCRQENIGGDVISYVMRRDNLAFKAACEVLGINAPARPRSYTNRQQSRQSQVVNFSEQKAQAEEWQQKAFELAFHCSDILFTGRGRIALEYLQGRGFTDSTLAHHMIGYNPRFIKTKWAGMEVNISQGIVIPWRYQGTFKLNVRRFDQEPKYLMANGSANGLFNAWNIKPDKPAVLVEGEFDCLAIQQAAGDLVTPVAAGSTVLGRLMRWVAILSIAPKHLIAFDVDENQAGENAAKWWLSVLPTAKRLQPLEHDANDMLRLLGPEAIREWVSNA